MAGNQSVKNKRSKSGVQQAVQNGLKRTIGKPEIPADSAAWQRPRFLLWVVLGLAGVPGSVGRRTRSSASARNARAVLRRRLGSLRGTASRMSDSIEYARTVTTLSTRSNPECRNGNLMTARIGGSVGEYGTACPEVLRSRPAGFGEDRAESAPGRDRVKSNPSRDDRRARCPGGVP